MAVWVTRPAPRNKTTEAALRSEGYDVISVPVLSVALEVPAALPAPRWPDWILFTSANAVEGLEHAVLILGVPAGARATVEVGVVGGQTGLAAKGQGWTVAAIGSPETAEGLLETLASESLRGKTVWIPSGNRGDMGSGVARVLGDRGATTMAFPVYANRNRAPSAEDIKTLSAPMPEAVVFHSPSAAEAVWGATVSAVRRWCDAPAVAIGPRTAERLKKLGADSVIECTSPSDEGVLAALNTLRGQMR